MSVTIMEALQNANYNLSNRLSGSLGNMQLKLAGEQLNNGVVLLEKGYSLYDEVEPLLEKYGSVEDVPERQTNEQLKREL